MSGGERRNPMKVRINFTLTIETDKAPVQKRKRPTGGQAAKRDAIQNTVIITKNNK